MSWRLASLALAALALAAGLYGGLWRMGWPLPAGAPLAEIHGPLLISGVFGTLISLERAVALGSGIAYSAPLLSGFGTLALLTGVSLRIGAGLQTLAAFSLAVGTLGAAIREPALHTAALVIGALTWLVGNGLWLADVPVPDVVGWWLAFLVLTIAAERLELSRLLETRRGSQALFAASLLLMVAGAQASLPSERGALCYGIALLVIAGWLWRHDLARINIRRTGQTRFMAVCMLAGYAWLAVSGAALLVPSVNGGAFAYDLVLHAIVIGFVLSMVFGHALIILPAVARLRIRYTPALYGPLALLHFSLAWRIGADLGEWTGGRVMSGMLTLSALAAFALTLMMASGSRRRQGPRGASEARS